MSETNVWKQIQIDFSHGDCRLIRNNTGLFYTLDMNRKVFAGLGEGSSDLVGVQAITITPEMVGKKIGVAVILEAKKEKKDGGKNATKAQEVFHRVGRKLGCISGLVRNSEDYKIILANFLASLQS